MGLNKTSVMSDENTQATSILSGLTSFSEVPFPATTAIKVCRM